MTTTPSCINNLMEAARSSREIHRRMGCTSHSLNGQGDLSGPWTREGGQAKYSEFPPAHHECLSPQLSPRPKNSSLGSAESEKPAEICRKP